MEKAPQIGLGLLGASPIPKKRKKKISISIDSSISIFYCLGIQHFSVYFQINTWLHSHISHRFIVLEQNAEAWNAFLSAPEARYLIQDSQVEFFSNEESLNFFIQQFPAQHISIYPTKHPLKKHLLQATASSYGIYTNFQYGDQIFYNFVQNVQQLSSSFYANSFQDAFPKVPAIICGAGSSLQEAASFLRTVGDKALILAGGSAIAALSYEGIKPHFCLAADPNFDEYLRFKNSFCFETPFLYSTRVCPLLFQTCNGPFGYMKSGMAGPLEQFLETKLGLVGPSIQEATGLQGGTITLLALGFALFLGCDPIILTGVDLAYTNGVRYAPGVIERNTYPMHSVEDTLVRTKNQKGQKVFSAIRWMNERDDIAALVLRHPKIKFLNTTENGLFIPHVKYSPFPKFKRDFDLRFTIHQKIGKAPMPKVKGVLLELKMSLDRTIECLRILTGMISGKSKVLAEIDLKEEITYDLFFREGHFNSWESLLEMAERYRRVLS